jgi:hypothetical protein
MKAIVFILLSSCLFCANAALVDGPDGVARAEAPAGTPPDSPAPPAGGGGSQRVGVGLKMSTLGAGIESAVEVSNRINIRGGFNDFKFDHSFTNSGIHYNGNLSLRSATTNLDYYVLGPLHLSPGVLFYDANKGSAAASVPGGQTFTLGNNAYLSSPGNPATGSGTLGFKSVAPEFLIGVGNLVPRNGHRFSVNFEFGATYQGAPAVKLSLGGTVCTPYGANCVNAATDPAVQSNVLAQQSKLTHDLRIFKFYPVVSLGVGYRF